MTMLQLLDGESLQVAIDFGNLLGSGETLSSVTGVTVDPTGELSIGAPAISGDTIVFTTDATSATVVGRRYLLTGTVVTSDSETLVEYATVALL